MNQLRRMKRAGIRYGGDFTHSGQKVEIVKMSAKDSYLKKQILLGKKLESPLIKNSF